MTGVASAAETVYPTLGLSIFTECTSTSLYTGDTSMNDMHIRKISQPVILWTTEEKGKLSWLTGVEQNRLHNL
jgi:hypothetical protein